MKTYDVVIIGAGPAGMAAAIELKKKNIDNILLIERSQQLGGILNQCIHPGFGLTFYKEELTGPEYARRMEEELKKEQVPLLCGTMVLKIDEQKVLTLANDKGIKKIKAKIILMATGCRERTRENIEVAGSRPAGVYSAGLAQKLINCHNLKIGSKVIIQGSGDIGLIMARRLALEGYQVIKVLERLPYLSGLLRNKIQCLDDFKITLQLKSSIISIEGNDRVNAVQVETPNGVERIECDTVLFSVGLIPELDILPKKRDDIFICGNARVIHDLADDASTEAKQFAWAIADYLAKGNWREPPAKASKKGSNYNQTFFENKQGKLVCTLCPRACTVTETTYGCPKGKEFFEMESSGKKRIITTTLKDPRFSENLPLRSQNPIPLEDSAALVQELAQAQLDSSNLVTVREQIFQATLPWTTEHFKVN